MHVFKNMLIDTVHGMQIKLVRLGKDMSLDGDGILAVLHIRKFE